MPREFRDRIAIPLTPSRIRQHLGYDPESTTSLPTTPLSTPKRRNKYRRPHSSITSSPLATMPPRTPQPTKRQQAMTAAAEAERIKREAQEKQTAEAVEAIRTGSPLNYDDGDAYDADDPKGKKPERKFEAEPNVEAEPTGADTSSREAQTPSTMELHRQTIRQEVNTHMKAWQADTETRQDARFAAMEQRISEAVTNAVLNSLESRFATLGLRIQDPRDPPTRDHIDDVTPAPPKVTKRSSAREKLARDNPDDERPPARRYAPVVTSLRPTNELKPKQVGLFRPEFDADAVVTTSEGDVFTDVYDYVRALRTAERLYGSEAVKRVWPQCLRGEARDWWSCDLQDDDQDEYLDYDIPDIWDLLIGEFKLHEDAALARLDKIVPYDFHDVRANRGLKDFARSVIRYARAAGEDDYAQMRRARLLMNPQVRQLVRHPRDFHYRLSRWISHLDDANVDLLYAAEYQKKDGLDGRSRNEPRASARDDKRVDFQQPRQIGYGNRGNHGNYGSRRDDRRDERRNDDTRRDDRRAQTLPNVRPREVREAEERRLAKAYFGVPDTDEEASDEAEEEGDGRV